MPSLSRSLSSSGLGRMTRLMQSLPVAFTREFEKLVLVVINDLGKALNTTILQCCRFLQLLTRAVAHCDSFLAPCCAPCPISSVNFARCFLCNTSLRSSTAPSWDVWMVVGLKEAETFKRVAAASLSNVNCSLSWARETKETLLVITESAEPANGSDNSKGSIALCLLSLTTVEQRQKVTTYTIWLRILLSLKNTGRQVPDQRFVKSCWCLRAVNFA